MDSSSLMLAVAALALFSGCVLLFLAYRGRRVDDHPLCRKCRRDLTGLPPTSDRCPECGVNIRTPNATCHGNRQRRTRLLYAGWFITLPAFLLSATLLTMTLAHVDFIRYKPFFLLRADLQDPSPIVADTALGEILRRIHDGKLNASDLAPFLDELLGFQGQPAHRWNTRWGTLISVCHDHGLLTPAQWERFLTQAIEVTFLTNAKVHHGIIPEINFRPVGPRFDGIDHGSSGPIYKLQIKADLTIENVNHDHAIDLQIYCTGAGKPLEGGVSSEPIQSAFGWTPLADGIHTLHITYSADFIYADGTHGTRKGSQDVPFEVVPTTVPLVKVNHDPAVKAAMLRALTFSSPGQPRSVGVPDIRLPLPAPLAAGQGDFMLQQDHAPMRTMFTMELVQGDVHWPFANDHAVLPEQRYGPTPQRLDRTRIPATLPHPGPAEIVLTPAPDILNPNASPVSLRTPPEDLSEIFGEELHIPINLVAP